MIAILALQGAFAEHQQMLDRLGEKSLLIRNLSDWNAFRSAPDSRKGLIIPGGESTTMMRLLNDLELFHPIRSAIVDGLPVFGTCAGLILLDTVHLGTMNMTARRNAYGRQLGSFEIEHECKGLGVIPMTFIRAPYIAEVGPEVEVLAIYDDHIIAARQGHQLVTAFHPELNTDTRVHEFFLKEIV